MEIAGLEEGKKKLEKKKETTEAVENQNQNLNEEQDKHSESAPTAKFQPQFDSRSSTTCTHLIYEFGPRMEFPKGSWMAVLQPL